MKTDVVMPPHSADAADGSGNYFGIFDGQNFLPVKFGLTAHVLIDGVEVPGLVVNLTFIKN